MANAPHPDPLPASGERRGPRSGRVRGRKQRLAAPWIPAGDCPRAGRRPDPWAGTMADAKSAAELDGEVDEILGDHVEIVLRLQIPGLVGTVLERPADEGGMEAASARRE